YAALTKGEKKTVKKLANAQITKRAPGLGPVGRTNFEPGPCTDDAHTGEDCTTVAMELPRRARVLVVATATDYIQALDDTAGPGSGSDNPIIADGSCRITANGTEIGPSARARSFDLAEYGGVALNRVTLPLDPGAYTFGMRCVE